jgi:hypothetical protein
MTWIARNPKVETALTLNDISPNLQYVCYIPGDPSSVEQGTFASVPEYVGDSDDRWVVEVRRKVGDKVVSQLQCLYDMGITPSGDGQTWADCVTIEQDL